MLGSITPATLSATRSWRAKTSSSVSSKRSDQIWAPVAASVRLTMMRTRCPSEHAAVEDVTHPEPAAGLLGVDGLAFEAQRRAARNDEDRADAAERRDHLVHHAFDEVLLVDIPAEVGEGQQGDGRLVRQRRRGERSDRRAAVEQLGHARGHTSPGVGPGVTPPAGKVGAVDLVERQRRRRAINAELDQRVGLAGPDPPRLAPSAISARRRTR